MAFTKKTYVFLFVAVAVVIGGAIALYFIFREPPVKNPNENGTPVPAGSPSVKWIPESFPLDLGMFGLKIRALQKALGFTGADIDDKLYTVTRDAIIAKGYAFPLSEADYNKIVNPAAIGGGSNFQAVKNALGAAGKNFTGGVTGYMSGPNQVYSFNFYTNGRVFIYDSTGKELKKGTYSNGGKTIAIDNGKSYSSSSVTINMQNIANDLG